MKRIIKCVATMLSCLMILTSGMFVKGEEVQADVKIALDSTNFPDPAFLDYVLNNLPISNSEYLTSQDIEKIVEIDIGDDYYGDPIEDVKGIEHFTSLESLCILYQNVNSIDLSSNVNLKDVDISLCFNFESVNITGLTKLENLALTLTNISSIDLSTNTELKNLDLCNTCLTSLDISNNPKLENILVWGVDLEKLNISANPKLLEIYSNPFEKGEYTNFYPRVSFWLDENEKGIKVDSTVEIDLTPIPTKEVTPTEEPVVTTVAPTNTVTPTVEVTKIPTAVVTTTATPTVVVTTTATPTVVVTTTATPTLTSTPTPTVEVELNVGDFVNRCYNVAFNRKADTEGFNYWCDMLNNGQACGAQVGYGFIFSPEYIIQDKNNGQFVKDLYAMFFGREADSEGYEYWLSELNAGKTREDIFSGFANSLEFYNLCNKYNVVQGYYIVGMPLEQQGGVNCFVARLYKTCLNRLPDMAGQSGWVMKLIVGEVTGTDAARGFVFSQEFIELGLTNEEYVTYMYRAFFGREADKEGFDAWVKDLNNATSREVVFDGFANSAEFINLCASYGIIS